MERIFTEQELVRRGKLEEIKKITNPYPEKFERTHTIKDSWFLPLDLTADPEGG